jgi:hypothetical protein
MVGLLRRRQTKEAATDMSSLQPPRHISTYMKARLSRGVSAVFGDLDSSCFRIGGSGQAPQPRSGAPKAQGLRAPSYPKHHRRDRKYFLVKYSCVWFCFRSKASPLRACSSRGTNLYPAGYNPSQGPSCALRGRGLRGRWDHSLPRRLSAMSRSGHTSTLDFISSCYRRWVSLPFENGASRNQASFKITP